MRHLIKIFKALSDPSRIRILKMLEIRSLCVCEISEVLHLANSTVSKHLSILRDAELIQDEKVGKWVNYYINRSTTELYVKEIVPLLAQWLQDDEILQQDAETVKKVDRLKICGG